jgi:cytochrome c-type biogenesis protein CcmH/NrfG
MSWIALPAIEPAATASNDRNFRDGLSFPKGTLVKGRCLPAFHEQQEAIMAQQMHTETRWENEDKKLHREEELPATKARQGRTGRRILTVLVVALILAFIVWVPVEIWGSHEAEQAAPPPAQNQIQQSTAPNKTPETPAEVDAQHR